MFCRNCGKEVADGAKFCRECGAAVAGGNKSGGVTIHLSKNAKIGIAVAAVIAAVVAAVIFISANSHKLSGKWGNGGCMLDDGSYYYAYKVEFDRNGTARWEQNGIIFQGNWVYYSDSDDYLLTVGGSGIYSTTSFKIKVYGSSLIVSGGVFNEDEFVRLN